ncbi:MAG TPA: DUF4349 domain-containing protein [Coriobacteriia bacterium]
MRHVALMVVAALAFSLAGCALSPQTSGVKSSGESAVSAGAAATAPNSTAPELTAQDAARASMPGVPAPTGTGGDASKVPPAQKLIVRNKTMRMETADVPGTITRIRDLVKRDGADISQLQVATALDEPIYRPAEGAGAASGGSSPALKAFITIRVPADRYQAFIDDAAKLGDVKFQTESADDVTQQHIDLKARLDNLRSEEAQLRQFFLKAKNVGEMLQIETELGRVRGEIESLAAQVAYLERQAAMATVTIELTEPKALVRPAGIDWGVGSAFTQSVRAFVSTMNVLIIVLGPVLALLVFLGLPAALVLWVVVRRLKKRRAKAAEATGTAPGAPAGNTDATDQRARG